MALTAGGGECIGMIGVIEMFGRLEGIGTQNDAGMAEGRRTFY